MAVKDNSIRFNSHKNINIKKMREKKDQIRTQDITELIVFGNVFWTNFISVALF
jgi:hypothetical protein